MPLDILAKIQSLKSSLFQGGVGSSSVVGVNVGSSFIKVVQLKKKAGVIVLETYGEIALGPYAGVEAGQFTNLEPEELGKAVSDLFREASVTASRAIFSIQSSASLIFVIELPALPEKELHTLIPNEAHKYIPVPLGEVDLDWWVIPGHHEHDFVDENEESKSEKMEVLMVAIHKDTISRYQTIMKSADKTGSPVEIEVFSMIRATFKHETNPVMIVDFGASGTRVGIVEYGVLKNFKTINRGSFAMSQAIAQSLRVPFTQAENLKHEHGLLGTASFQEVSEIIRPSANYIVSELSTALVGYERKYQKAIGKIILCGGGSLLSGFRELLEKEFKTDVFHAKPFVHTESPKFLEAVLDEVGPTFTTAVGLALRDIT